MLRKAEFDQVPLKPQSVYHAMNTLLDRDTCYVTTIGLSQIAGAQFLKVYNPRNWINAAQAGPLGWTMPAALGVRAALPDKKIVALSGDYDFQFMVEELAVGAQHKLPYLHLLLNNSYLGLIRQSQQGFDMEYQVSLAFENINISEEDDAIASYGVDHVALAEALGCKAIRIHRPEDFPEAFKKAEQLMQEYQVPVVVECILEPVTNISMGKELNCINEFEEILCLDENLSAETGWVSEQIHAAQQDS
jgi:tartronate-semialdehyde synthase